MGDYLHTRTVGSDPRQNTSLQLKVPRSPIVNCQLSIVNSSEAKAIGQLVVLGFDVAVFTPAPYQRHRL